MTQQLTLMTFREIDATVVPLPRVWKYLMTISHDMLVAYSLEVEGEELDIDREAELRQHVANLTNQMCRVAGGIPPGTVMGRERYGRHYPPLVVQYQTMHEVYTPYMH